MFAVRAVAVGPHFLVSYTTVGGDTVTIDVAVGPHFLVSYTFGAAVATRVFVAVGPHFLVSYTRMGAYQPARQLRLDRIS